MIFDRVSFQETKSYLVIFIFFNLVQILYNNGARKFALIGLGQIGCSPSELAQNSPDGRTCVQRINSANQIFNDKLRSLVAQFNGNTPDARFIYINAYGIFQDLITRPAAFGKYPVNPFNALSLLAVLYGCLLGTPSESIYY